AWSTRRGRCVNRGRLTARVTTQRRNRSQELTTVPERRYAKLLEVLRREVRQDRLVYLVLAEYRLILPEAQAPQPDHNVHDSAQTQGCGPSLCGRGRVSRWCPSVRSTSPMWGYAGLPLGREKLFRLVAFAAGRRNARGRKHRRQRKAAIVANHQIH